VRLDYRPGLAIPHRGWVPAASIAADITSWTRLHDHANLKDTEPDTLRYRIWRIPARLVRHSRKADPHDQPGLAEDAFLTCWQRLCALPAPS
jgi:hypothetical protein